MRVAVYAPNLFQKQNTEFKSFIVQTLSFHFHNYKEHSFVLLTEHQGTSLYPINVSEFKIRAEPQSSIGKKIWWDITIPKTLRKLKADIFISFGNQCSLTAFVPQSLMILDAETLKRRSLRKAGSILVAGNSAKRFLFGDPKVAQEKIFSIPPFADPAFKPIDTTQKQKIKEEYSGGKEFFLYNSSINTEGIIELLKAFSLFKKRQQSNLKLMITGQSSDQLEKSLSNYKYRDDVVWIGSKAKTVIAEMTAASYAVILPFNSKADIFKALNAMGAGSPVITTKNSDIYEVAGESVLAAETNSAKDISEKMMQIYIDEDLRSALVVKGKLMEQNYSLDKAARHMWGAFMKAMN